MFKKFSFNTFYFIYILLSVWILISGFLHAEGSIRGKTIITACIFICFMLFSHYASKAEQVSPKSYLFLVISIFCVFYFSLLTFGITTMTVPISDLEVLVLAAEHWLKNGNILDYSSYFTICKNTLGNCIFIYIMFLPLHCLGIDIHSDYAECWGIAVNCLMIVITVYYLYRIATRVLKNRNFELLFLLFCCCYIPFFLWSHRYYSDTLSLPFLSLSILLYLKSRENNGIKMVVYALLCGISLWTGYFIRGSIIIVLVAVMLFSMFCDKKYFIKSGFCVFIAFLISTMSWNIYVHNNNWIDYSNEDIYAYPLTMWFMYGAHGDGNYNDEDVNLLKSYSDYESRKVIAKEKLKEYYSRYDIKSYLEFLTLKYSITYGNGLFDSENYLNNQRHTNFTHYFLLDGMPFTAPFRYIANGMHFFTLIMAVVSGFINWRKGQWNIPMLMQIILVGNILFFSFWETKARYAFGITPILLFLTIYSFYELLHNKTYKKAEEQLIVHKSVKNGHRK